MDHMLKKNQEIDVTEISKCHKNVFFHNISFENFIHLIIHFTEWTINNDLTLLMMKSSFQLSLSATIDIEYKISIPI